MNRPKVLIVEDDPFIALDFVAAFEAEGFRVLGPVTSVSQALRLVTNVKPDAATLDYNLGAENSLPIAEVLKDVDVPFVFVTGQDAGFASETDFPDIPVYTKPINPNEIAVGLLQVLDIRS